MRAKCDVQVRLPKLCRGAVKGAGHREQSHALDPPIAAQAESPVNTDGEMEVEEEQGTPEYTFMTLHAAHSSHTEHSVWGFGLTGSASLDYEFCGQ